MGVSNRYIDGSTASVYRELTEVVSDKEVVVSGNKQLLFYCVTSGGPIFV